MVRCLGVSRPSSPANQSAAAAIDRSVTWLMVWPSIFTASASGFSRWPTQASQGRTL